MIYSHKPYNAYKALEIFSADLFSKPCEWNLYYLSEVRLDDSIEVSEDYPSEMQIFWACHLLCAVYPNIAEALITLPPLEAIEVIKSEPNIKNTNIFELLGDKWFETMLDRAALPEPRGIQQQVGNVLTVNFGKN